MIVLDVVVLLEQEVVVLIVIDIPRVARTGVMVHLRHTLDGRRPINKVIWGFVLSAEADITCGGVMIPSNQMGRAKHVCCEKTHPPW